ncbi:MAG: hypothetical protein LBV19_07080 [Streptococcaceae bacterium]|jgi:hypothetical protein|nr:hypothetical protein [Streptococcaceae bacterium]
MAEYKMSSAIACAHVVLNIRVPLEGTVKNNHRFAIQERAISCWINAFQQALLFSIKILAFSSSI